MYIIKLAGIAAISMVIIPFLSSYANAESHSDIVEETDSMFETEVEIEDVGETYEDAIVGKVLLVGDNTIRVYEDSSGRTYDLTVDQDMLENVSTGYRIAVRTEDGEVTFIQVLGLHKEAEPVIVN